MDGECDFDDSVLERVRRKCAEFALRQKLHEDLDASREWLDAEVRAGKMSAAQAARFFDFMKRACPAPSQPTADEVAAAEFVKRLQGRQGTNAPDFDSLYRRKAELDQRGLT